MENDESYTSYRNCSLAHNNIINQSYFLASSSLFEPMYSLAYWLVTGLTARHSPFFFFNHHVTILSTSWSHLDMLTNILLSSDPFHWLVQAMRTCWQIRQLDVNPKTANVLSSTTSLVCVHFILMRMWKITNNFWSCYGHRTSWSWDYSVAILHRVPTTNLLTNIFKATLPQKYSIPSRF